MRHWILAGVIIAIIPAPAAADDWVREVSGWDVGRGGDTCIMTMEYEGAGATQLTLAIKDDAAVTMLLLNNYQWSTEDGKIYELKYHLGEWVYTTPSVGTRSSATRKGFGTKVSPEFLADFAKAGGLEITRDDVLVDDLSLDGSAAALVVLERCRRELARDLDQQRRDRDRLEHIPVDPFASASVSAVADKGPRDPLPMGTWANLIAMNYPARAIREGLEGRVGIALLVSAEGRVISCSVESSSGHAILDEAACQGAQRYGRFTAALDAQGNPTEGTYTTSITYSLG